MNYGAEIAYGIRQNSALKVEKYTTSFVFKCPCRSMTMKKWIM